MYSQMATVENTFLDYLCTATNLEANDGPSYKFHELIPVDEVFRTRTPAMVEFLVEAVSKYVTPGGCILDVACGSG